VLLGVPQSVWRGRHLAHHAGTTWRFRLRGRVVVELLLVLSLWTGLLVWAPWFFLTAYVPGYLLGLGLCSLHGYYEHRDGTTSHYGAVYNALCFNDGYHVEHHASPATHWTQLRRAADLSPRPPLLRGEGDGQKASARADLTSSPPLLAGEGDGGRGRT